MTDTQQTIGHLHTDLMARDAIHIAVAPVVACERLSPGQHIGLDDNGCARAGRTATGLIGIVDPFLPAPVQPQQRFWLFLYPNTITSLRHQWVHPAFAAGDAAEHSAAIQKVADAVGLSYTRTVAVFRDYTMNGTYETYETFGRDIDYPDDATIRQAWDDFARANPGVVVTDRTAYPFSCAC